MICVTVIINFNILWTWLFIFVLLVSNLNYCSKRKCVGLHDSRTWNHTSRWVVVYRSFDWRRSFDAHSHVPNWPNHYIKPHVVQCLGHTWHWWLWLLRVQERSQLRWARRIQLEAGLQPWQPLHVPRLNYSIIQPIIDHITGDDYRAMQLPFARGDCVYTSYHGFHESPYPEIRRHSLLPDNLQCVKGIKLPCDGWILQTRHAAMWFMPTANMHNLIRSDI